MTASHSHRIVAVIFLDFGQTPVTGGAGVREATLSIAVCYAPPMKPVLQGKSGRMGFQAVAEFDLGYLWMLSVRKQGSSGGTPSPRVTFT